MSSELVSTCISQQDSFLIYPVSLRVKRYGWAKPQTAPDRSGSNINSFSDHSRRRLRFRALNACPALVSQFGLTYHDQWPSDGRLSKAHLNAWLTALRRILPGVGYLWLLEFQKRNAPHYHVFLTVKPDEETRLKLAAAWCRITSPDDSVALRFHQDQRNWVEWDMGSGSYLCKYLDKEAQKFVPLGYVNFGRFWGNSRGLEADPDVVSVEDVDLLLDVDHETGVFTGGSSTVIRWLGRLAEKQTCGYSRFRTRAAHGSYSILQGSTSFNRIINYLQQQIKENGDG